MEMERIDDDTIRVFMDLEELNDRGVKMLDLIKDHQQIEDFFYSILDEVDGEHQFAPDGPVTFQVMPSGQGLEIFITRIQPENADDTGAKKAPENPTTPTAQSGSQKPDNRLQAIARNSLSRFFDQPTDSETEPAAAKSFFDGASRRAVVLRLAEFDDLIALADELYLNGGSSDLYRYDDRYYLVLTFDADLVAEFDAERQAHLALEYGSQSKLDPAVLSEYGEHVMVDSALEITRYYFK